LPPSEANAWRSVERPIFIVGCERSGTTLLRRLVCTHSRLAISPETHFMPLIADCYGADEQPKDFDRFWHALTRHLQLRAIALDMPRARARVEASEARDFRTVFAALLAAQAEMAGKERVGEKTPGHEHHLERLFAWFPDAQVVFIRRDARACAASALETPWVTAQLRPFSFAAPLVRRLRVWHVAYKAQEWLASCRAEQTWRGAAGVTAIAYEDLVGAPEPTLRQLCAFLGEPWEPAMLDTRAASMTDPDKPGIRWREWNAAHEVRAGGPISDHSLDRWRQDLSELEIAIVEAVCGDELEVLGYPIASSVKARAEARLLCERVLEFEAFEHRAREGVKSVLTLPFRARTAEAMALLAWAPS
jgi:hypothetical protein